MLIVNFCNSMLYKWRINGLMQIWALRLHGILRLAAMKLTLALHYHCYAITLQYKRPLNRVAFFFDLLLTWQILCYIMVVDLLAQLIQSTRRYRNYAKKQNNV